MEGGREGGWEGGNFSPLFLEGFNLLEGFNQDSVPQIISD